MNAKIVKTRTFLVAAAAALLAILAVVFLFNYVTFAEGGPVPVAELKN